MLVLGAAAVISVVAYAFIAGQSTLAAVGTNIEDRARAQAIAESGLRIGLRRVQRDLDWRTALPDGVWVSNAVLDGGSFTLTATDGADLNGDGVIVQPAEGDGDLADDPADLVTLTCIGRSGGAVARLTAVVTPVPSDGLRILMLVPDPDALSAEDVARKQQMERWGWVVTPFAAAGSPAGFFAALAETDIVYVPRLTTAAPAAADWEFSTSVVSENPDLASAIGSAAGATIGASGTIDITNNSHEVTAGLELGSLSLGSGAGGAVLTAPLADGADVLASIDGQPAVVAIETGGLLYGATQPGLSASYYTLATAPSSLANVNWNDEPTATGVVTSINIPSSAGSAWIGGPTDNFAVRYSGAILVPEAGSWYFATNSDDGSALWIDGAQVVSNDGLHGMTLRGGTITLTQGSHAFEVRAFERGGSFGLIAHWDGPGVTAGVIPASAFVQGASPGRRVHLPLGGMLPDQMTAEALTLFRQAMEWAGGTAGLEAEYFAASSPGKLGDVDWSATPVAREEAEGINIPAHSGAAWSGGPTDDFGVRYRGFLDIPTSGDWTFELRSDDGSMLLVDGNVLIDNDGLHAMTTAVGTRTLPAGRHAIEVRAFERGGEFGVILSWRGPGMSAATVIPADAFSGPRQGGYSYAVAYR